MRSKILYEDFQHPDLSGRLGVTANLSRFLQKLELCNSENSEILHEHLKQSKLKVKGFGVDPNYKLTPSCNSGYLGKLQFAR
jgi:hypothetical protein